MASLYISDRKIVIIKELAHGKRQKEIATELHVSTSTVKRQVHELMAYYGVSSSIEVVYQAMKAGDIDSKNDLEKRLDKIEHDISCIKTKLCEVR